MAVRPRKNQESKVTPACDRSGGFRRGSQLAAQVAAGDCHARQPTPSGITDKLLPLVPTPVRDHGSRGPQSLVLAAGPKVFVKFKEWRGLKSMR